MHVDSTTANASQAAHRRPRARMSRLGRACASLAVAVVAVATAGFMTPALAANVNGGVLTMNGTAKTVATTSAGSIGYVTFVATAGQRVQLQTSASTYGTAPTVQLLSPSSVVLNTWAGNGLLDTVTLTAAGTYTFRATQVGGNGAITFKGWAVTDSSSALTLGTAKTVTTTQGQNAAVTFTATASQRFQFQTSGSTYGAGNEPTVQLIRPDGTTVQNTWTGNSFLDTTTLATAGTWTIKVDPPAMATGSITITAWAVSADTTAALTTGTAKTVTTTQGQNTAVTFTATANQRFQFQTSGSTYGAGNEPTVQLIRPDGTTVQTTWTGNSFLDTTTLATAGTWTIKVDPPAKAAGSITITAWSVANNSTGTLALNGNESNVATTQGQNSTLSFTLAANQRLQLETSASTYTTSPVITVYKPDGTTVVNTWNGNAFFDTTAYATAGTYTMVIDPVGITAGGIKVQAWNVPADATTPITPDGTPVTFTTVRGQKSNGTFSLTAGQRVMIKTSANTYGGADPTVKLIAPNGTTVLQSWSGDALKSPYTVSEAGTYTLRVDPSSTAAAGSIKAQVWIVPANQNFVQPLDGTATGIFLAPGQNATASFSVTAGQRLMFQTRDADDEGAPSVTLYKPDGTTVVSSWTGNNLTDVMTFPTAGTYTLRVTPADLVVGSMSLRIWNVPADIVTSAATNGSPTVLTTTPGQNATVSFTMAANSRVLVQTLDSTYTDDAWFTLYKPDGTIVRDSWSENDITEVLPLTSSGTYKVTLDPKDIGAGSIALRVWNVPNNFSASANLTGTAVSVATTAGQDATVTFAAAANQRVQIETSNSTYSDSIPVTLYGPDGSELASWSGDYLLDTTRLDAGAGTYSLRFDPEYVDAGSVSVQVWSVPEDANGGSMSLNGTPKSFTTVGGQNASVTFPITTVGQKIQIVTSGGTYDPTPRVY